MEIRLAGLEPESIVDGPGYRFTVFVQGCPHNCPGCHNPQTHDFSGGHLADTDDVIAHLGKNPLVRGLTLSGGELQRVLLALALEPMPNILILDEPLSGVDVEGMSLLMDMLDEIRKKFDLSILMTTHDFSMLERYCDQVVLLQGKILRRGTPLDVLSSDEFAKAFHMGGGAQA